MESAMTSPVYTLGNDILSIILDHVQAACLPVLCVLPDYQ